MPDRKITLIINIVTLVILSAIVISFCQWKYSNENKEEALNVYKSIVSSWNKEG